jgi:hypothetical protein
MAMAMGRFILAALLVLPPGVWIGGGAALAAPVHPIAAFNDFYQDSNPTGYLLGGSVDGHWLQPEAAAPLVPGGEKYRLYNLTGEVGTGVGGKPAKGDVPCTDAWYVTLAPAPPGRGGRVAVGGPWNAMPRPVTIIATEPQAYQAAAAEILKGKGIANPKVVLTQVLRVDLDGDGVEEVLVSATHFAGVKPGGGMRPSSRAGDYSLVFLRKVVQGQVVTRIITGEYYPKAKEFNAPAEHRIMGVLDLNGDGILEIVLSGRYYEGDWVEAFRVDGAKVIKLFTMGCGA